MVHRARQKVSKFTPMTDGGGQNARSAASFGVRSLKSERGQWWEIGLESP
jgi:hypothetical protein